jgi:dolichol-phosphate mannosyltransferase
MKPNFSVVVPAKNEDEGILRFLIALDNLASQVFECILVVDNPNDSTLNNIQNFEFKNGSLVICLNDSDPGFPGAIKCGIKKSTASVVVISMADGSDDVSSIPLLVGLVNRGVTIACASRYMSGGQQIGAPKLKGNLSKIAGISFGLITSCGTKDATNNFKAYSKEFLNKNIIESNSGFQVGLELVAKAARQKLPIAEIPTIWIERTYGISNFNLRKSLKPYLKWYFYGIGWLK